MTVKQGRRRKQLLNDLNDLEDSILKHVFEGKIKRRLKMTGKQGRRRKKLVNDLEETRGYLELKAETLDRTLWGTGFSRGQ
jgi:transcriptional regulator of NAD metabolism